jgi:hypothetical protein
MSYYGSAGTWAGLFLWRRAREFTPTVTFSDTITINLIASYEKFTIENK